MLLRLKKNETTRSGHSSNSGKSFSDSLKKHILHNTLVSKTPKRFPTTATHNNINVSRHHFPSFRIINLDES